MRKILRDTLLLRRVRDARRGGFTLIVRGDRKGGFHAKWTKHFKFWC